MILDEPTAALDARSDFEVFRRFKELSAGKTAILIAHRWRSPPSGKSKRSAKVPRRAALGL
jgi:energy-coupling factor transporter ATP-binding protein EcfA2